jgi:hypothetical protein
VSISTSVIESFTGSLPTLNSALIHRLSHCIAARSYREILHRRGSRRLPSSLNMRSHSLLESGIDSMSIANLLRSGYQSCSPTQYCIGFYALWLFFLATGSLRFPHLYSSSSLSVTPAGSIILSIASSIPLAQTIWRARGFGKRLYESGLRQDSRRKGRRRSFY